MCVHFQESEEVLRLGEEGGYLPQELEGNENILLLKGNYKGAAGERERSERLNPNQ